MRKKHRQRDRYFSEDLPSNNYDFVEVSIGDLDSLDRYINASPIVQRTLGNYFVTDKAVEDREKYQKRSKRLLRKVLQAASQILTDRQFQIFILRFVFNLTEEQVAERLTRQYVGRPRLDKKTKRTAVVKKLSQPYVSQVVEKSILKIQKHLRLKDKHSSAEAEETEKTSE